MIGYYMVKNRWLHAWGLGSVAAGGASLLVPLYVIELGAGATGLGVLSAVAAIAGAIGAFVFGRLADSAGHWQQLGGLSMGGIAVSLMAVPLVREISLIIVINGILWLSFSGATPVFTLLTVAGVSAADRTRRIAQLNRIQGYGWALGLAAGTVWTAGSRFVGLDPLQSQRGFFTFCAVTAVIGVVAAIHWLPAGERGESIPERKRSISSPVMTANTFPFLPSRFYLRARTVRPKRFVDRFTPSITVYFLAVILFFAGFGVFFAPLPAFLADAGYLSEHIFLLYVVAGLGSAAFFTKAGELTTDYDVRGLQAGALGVRGLALPIVAIVGGVGMTGSGMIIMAVVFTVLGVAWAVIAITATAFISDEAPPAIRGETLGVYTALSALAGGVGSIVGGLLADTVGFTVTFGIAGIIVIASAAIVDRHGTVTRVGRRITSPVAGD